MKFIKFNDDENVYSGIVKQNGEYITVQFFSVSTVNTSGFTTYRDQECTIVTGRYEYYKTVWKPSDNDKILFLSEDSNIYNVYAACDDNGLVTSIISTTDVLTDTLIKQGQGMEYKHPSYQLIDEDNLHNYKIADGEMVSTTETDKYNEKYPVCSVWADENELSYVTDIYSDYGRVPGTDSILIKTGQGEEYKNPSYEVLDTDGIYNYKIVDGALASVSDEEKAMLMTERENLTNSKLRSDTDYIAMETGVEIDA